MNSVTISGKAVDNAVKSYTRGNAPVVNFKVAVNRPNTADVVDYLDCVAFDAVAENAEKIKAGDTILVNGYITTHSKEKNGLRTKYTEIRCNAVELS